MPVNVQTEEEETQAVYIMLILYRTVNTEIPSEIRDFEEYLSPPHPRLFLNGTAGNSVDVMVGQLMGQQRFSSTSRGAR